MLKSGNALALIHKVFPIAGIDEVGYGPLAGPVVVGCVMFPKEVLENPPKELSRVDDSKKLSDAARAELSIHIQEHALAVGFGKIEAETIDRINIREATNLAIQDAIDDCTNIKPMYILLDGNYMPQNLSVTLGHTIIKGDASEFSIAAASIVAKVFRDILMVKLDVTYPEYGFKNHKGYGTAEHIANIRKHGAIEGIHRMSFLTKIMGGTYGRCER